MNNRLIDLFIGMACGFYLPPTVPVCGVNVHWVLVALGIILAIHFTKKLGGFLKKKIVAAVVKELKKQNDLKM
ncbi:hypothetical protein COM21_28310 [Bacillus toyonensis]|uniref:hypothetical protein n=1 Tax=Bacillus toyonensis TaxID=155322 RepID=UPI000B42FA47|nr:hypothetical protein [Bacillus toyonensis]OTW94362.1 hypothetical protein BK702_02970 [Bacillus thuringiensis serovar cameroun]PGC62884.1 hypothetical protein COM21_28310 [Bacillus toyonensis]